MKRDGAAGSPAAPAKFVAAGIAATPAIAEKQVEEGAAGSPATPAIPAEEKKEEAAGGIK